MNETQALKTTTTDRESRETSRSRDIARRDLDMDGHRILNVGEPKEEGEFTHVDLDATPKPASGRGSPGKSLLAAAADHVHPTGEGGGGGDSVIVIEETDDSYQTVTGTDEQLVAEFLLELPKLDAKGFILGANALVKAEGGTATFQVRFGGEPGEVDGKKHVSFETSKRDWEAKGAAGGPLTVPRFPDLVKITARNDKRDGVAHIKFKKVSAAPDDGES